MAELSPSSSGSHLRVAPASPLAISNERTDERTTEVSDDCGIPELSDVRARVTDFNKVEANSEPVYRVVYGAPFDRFFAKVDKNGPNGCWIWTAAHHEAGYGRFLLNGKLRPAHRVSHEWFIGPIPDGYHIDHLCRKPACVNPSHIEAVTVRENTLRGLVGLLAAKTHCLNGHEFTPENTRKGGGVNGRECKKCNTLRARKRDRGVAPNAEGKQLCSHVIEGPISDGVPEWSRNCHHVASRPGGVCWQHVPKEQVA